MTYFNTTQATNPELKVYQDKAATQGARILSFMKQSNGVLTPSAALKWIFKDSCPITSVRRAITDLTTSGDLIKTDAQTKGKYGRNEFIWRLADKHLQEDLFA